MTNPFPVLVAQLNRLRTVRTDCELIRDYSHCHSEDAFRELVERHLGNLSSSQQSGQTLRLSQLVQLNDYPEPRFISGFYAQSVSLVEYLSSLRGPQEFSQFLRDAQREGYEASLNRHFGIRSFTDLEQRWSQYASRGRATDTGLAAKQP